MININQTAEDFTNHPSMSKAQEIESNVEGAVADYGYSNSRGGKHPILTEEDTNNEPY